MHGVWEKSSHNYTNWAKQWTKVYLT